MNVLPDIQIRPQGALRVLMISFACSPRRGGEHLLGWEWARRTADRGHEVLVLTRAKYITESADTVVRGLRLVPVPDDDFAVLRSFGGVGRQIYYHVWNRRAAGFARELCDAFRPDIVHQCTFHTVRRPCLPALWGAPPVIWGPVAGLESAPLALLPAMGPSGAAELVRKVVTAVQTRSPTIRRCLNLASHVIVSNKATLGELERMAPRRYELMPANAVEPLDTSPYVPPTSTLNIVVVGLLVPMRPFSLLLKALAQLDKRERNRINVSFIGGGPTLRGLKSLSHRLGLQSRVHFLGRVSRDDTLAAMRNAHLMAFLSLRDSGSSSVAEAMMLGLPVLALDLAGPGAMLSRGGGFLIKPRGRSQVVTDIRQTIRRLLNDPQLLVEASRQGRMSAQALFDWPSRLDRMEQLYRSAIQVSQSQDGVARRSAVAPGLVSEQPSI